MTERLGHHFLQIPGPGPVPERVLRALAAPVIDHRGAAFGSLGLEVLEGCKRIFQTNSPVVIYPSSGTGAWEAALVNTLSPGDRVLTYETGHFATLWARMALRLGLEVDVLPGDWRGGADPVAIETRLAEDRRHAIKALMVVHNETSTGSTSRIAEIRKAMDRTNHPALLMVDAVSSLGSIDYRHDEWAVDVTVSGSQKGLMLPPGLGFNAISAKALAASKSNAMPRSYWDWGEMLKANAGGFFPFTPSTNLLYGLREAITILIDEGLTNVFARHDRLAATTRVAVEAWGLEIMCRDPAEYSSVVTAVFMPSGHDADGFRNLVLDKFNMSLGTGLGKVAGKVFRIGHLGECNELILLGALSGIEMGLDLAGVPHRSGGVDAAMQYLTHASREVAGPGLAVAERGWDALDHGEPAERQERRSFCMMTQEENDRVTRTGPDTPCGKLLRSYWQPIAAVEEIPPGGDPLPIRIMSEDLVLFRDDRDRLGLIGAHCPHRGTDLSYGRVEDGGLRCLYHGWLFDISGKCIDQPAEPEGKKFCQKVRHLSYPVQVPGTLVRSRRRLQSFPF